MRIGRLNIGISNTNEDNNFVLAAWAHESGYWRWCIWLRRIKVRRPGFGPSKAMGTKYRITCGRTIGWIGAWLAVPFVGVFSFSTQPPAIKPTKRADHAR